jgi:SAM-dependent methyltransferase
MAQVTTGLRRLLSHPAIYEGFQAAVGAARFRRILVRDYLRVRSGQRVLDVGCGPADILEHLPEIRYVGIDLSAPYVESARQRFGARGRFFNADVARLGELESEPFDLVIAVGLLHHLDDAEAVELLRSIRPRLALPGGRLVTIDGCYAAGQSRLAAFLLSRDRGRNVRPPEGYVALGRKVFARVEASVRHDMLRIPFSHCILQIAA